MNATKHPVEGGPEDKQPDKAAQAYDHPGQMAADHRPKDEHGGHDHAHGGALGENAELILPVYRASCFWQDGGSKNSRSAQAGCLLHHLLQRIFRRIFTAR